jgi:hypothetical protein
MVFKVPQEHKVFRGFKVQLEWQDLMVLLA